jgi:hypothetical protein
MSNPDQNSNLIRALEALLRAPETGRAVAETLMSGAAKRAAPPGGSGARASGHPTAVVTEGETEPAMHTVRTAASPWAR